LTTLIIITPQKAGQKPLIVNWVRNLSANNNSPTFIIMLNKPSVRNTTGKDISSIIGLTKAFIKPITIPAISKSKGEPEKINPGI
jgi:hypothetical protein